MTQECDIGRHRACDEPSESCKESPRRIAAKRRMPQHCTMRNTHRFFAVGLLVALPYAALGAQQIPGRVHDPDSLQWRPAGAHAEIAVVDGDPQSEGNFAIALRFGAGGMIPPHFHPKETRVVVIRGEVRVGFADTPDTLHARVIGPGGYAVIPAEAHHFEAGKTDAFVIVYGVGPLKTTMVQAGASHP
jgi:quercetin dioxygenase-like cupin family protein